MDDPPPGSGSRPRRESRLHALLRLMILAGALVHPLARLVGRWSWLGDLVSHFQAPAVGATLVALGIHVRRDRWVSLLLLVLAAGQVWPLVRYDLLPNPDPPDPARPERLRLLMTNVLYENFDCEPLEQLIRAERPDIVGLVEFTPHWRVGLSRVAADYPYRMEIATGASGLALWFRAPPTRLDPPSWPLAAPANPVIHAVVPFAGGDHHLWLVHPRSPLLRPLGEVGNPELAAIADMVRRTGGSRIVMGDLNTTDGSAHFHDLLDRSGLRDSRTGFGRQGSWRTDLPLRLPIDHLLVSADLAVADRRLGPNIGSDHFPLIVDLAPGSATPQRRTNATTQSARSSAASTN